MSARARHQATTRVLDGGKRAPGSAGAGAAKSRVLDDGERAAPGGSAEAGAAATGALDDGERSAMSRELGASRTLSQVQWRAGWPAGRRESR